MENSQSSKTIGAIPPNLTYRLAEKVKELLLVAVEVAKKNGTMDVVIAGEPSRLSGAFDYDIYDIHRGRNGSKTVREARGNPLRVLEHVGFLSKLGNMYYLVRPIAFDRADYENKSPVARFFVRLRYRAWAVAVTLSIILSVVATALSIIAAWPQIAELF
ncbi:MAG: hypothetical protein ACOC6F_03095 [bacterium]